MFDVIRRAIAEGEVGSDERLPLARDIAAVHGVNKYTVLRAMHILRDEGLLEFTRGRGITVTGTPENSADLRHRRESASSSLAIEAAGEKTFFK